MKNLEIERKFDEIVAFAELEPFIDTPVKHYSSSMYVRLAFAVAAHLEPDILLVDEVLAVGDAAFQKKCLGKMGDASRQGRTVLFVTHNMSAILNLCSRAYLLEQGRVAAEGLTADVVRRYLESLGSDRVEDLASYRNRQGRGRVRFSRVSFEDERGRAIQQAMSGEALALVLHYQSQSENDLPNCRASIAVEDPLGQPLFVCSTEMISREPLTFPSAGRLRCLIQQLPLSQGRYNLTLFLEVNREIEDWLPSAVSLSVTDGDFFKSGRQYPDGWQGKGVLVPHCWEVVGR
jgi:lipopolysaccharide transport system ATP-binding protein